MKYKSKGIALTYIKYGDTSIISKVFTQELGLQSFIIKGARGKSSKKRVVFFEPLTLINITATYNSKKSLQFLSEVTAMDSINFTTQNMNKKFIHWRSPPCSFLPTAGPFPSSWPEWYGRGTLAVGWCVARAFPRGGAWSRGTAAPRSPQAKKIVPANRPEKVRGMPEAVVENP